MTTTILGAVVGIYILGLLVIRRNRYSLLAYLWGAFGLAAILILVARLGRWYVPLGSMEANILASIGNLFGLGLIGFDTASILVPDPEGWSVLEIGIECSTIIEISVFAGLLLFYPRFPPGERILRLLAGFGATFLINLARLSIIIGMVAVIGKSAVPLAHAVVGRLVFFIGIVIVYWRMLTLPTLRLVRRELEVSGRAVK